MGSSPQQAKEAAEEGNFVYGTDINEEQVKNDFRRFILEEQHDYITELVRTWERQSDKTVGIKFSISGSHIQEFNNKLYDHLVTFPT